MSKHALLSRQVPVRAEQTISKRAFDADDKDNVDTIGVPVGSGDRETGRDRETDRQRETLTELDDETGTEAASDK